MTDTDLIDAVHRHLDAATGGRLMSRQPPAGRGAGAAQPSAFTAGSPWAANRDALLALPRRQAVLLAADWAADVLPAYEAAYPDAVVYAAYAAANAAAADAADAYAAAAAAAVYAANAAADAAAYAAAYAASWDAVHARWLAAWHGGRAFDPAWRTPLARQLAADPEAYPVLLDHLADLGAEVDDLRGLAWARSNWAVFHLTEVCDGAA